MIDRFTANCMEYRQNARGNSPMLLTGGHDAPRCDLVASPALLRGRLRPRRSLSLHMTSGLPTTGLSFGSKLSGIRRSIIGNVTDCQWIYGFRSSSTSTPQNLPKMSSAEDAMPWHSRFAMPSMCECWGRMHFRSRRKT
jgi:hypothetical protein